MLNIDDDEGLDVKLTRELVEIAHLHGIADTEPISDLTEAEDPQRIAGAERRLGAFERLFWLLDQNRPFHFAVTAQIAGRASRDNWRKALHAMQRRHPLLSCCIEAPAGSVPWFRARPGAPIPLTILDGDPKADWQGIVAAELAVPFDTSRAPLIRAVVVQGEADTALILVAHHTMADGLSLAYAIRDTLMALAGNPLEPLPALPSQEDILGPGEAVRQGENAAAGVPGRFRAVDGTTPNVSGLSLPWSLTRKLRHRAREAATTVHGALSAALTIAGARVFASWGERPVRIISPLNIRPLLGVGNDCGVFSTACTGSLDSHAGNFWDLAHGAKAELASAQRRSSIAANLSAITSLVDGGLDVAGAAEFATMAFAHEAVLTNLGELPFSERYGDLRLEQIWGPAATLGLADTHTIGVATLSGSICLTHTRYGPGAGLLEAMRDILVEACR